ncbi:hypothetical protein LTR37_020722 [Vermiconidia calcicola]|uniref:Uncharacterized protein n=1 Tax=Vermiconidia calcicola TaxID=1690605 RepID=A0ACC3MBQ9_9PEZI|nr:hypothetical protein LTR37_020722 [Vermiconidia calcicola]
MASHIDQKHCYILNSPREIRNSIYGYIKSDYVPTRRPVASFGNATVADPPTIVLIGFPIFPLLLVNRQIHAEYLESTLAARKLMVDFRQGSAAIDFGLPTKALTAIRRCDLLVPWGLIMILDTGRQKAWDWLDNHALALDERSQSMAWTPSKVLSCLKGSIADDAEIVITIMLDGLPDPEDLVQVGLMRTGALHCPVAARLRASFFHEPTLSELQTENRDWPHAGKLFVQYSIVTLASCTVEDRAVALAKWEKGHGQKYKSGSCVLWLLAPTKDESHFRGFFPKSFQRLKADGPAWPYFEE